MVDSIIGIYCFVCACVLCRCASMHVCACECAYTCMHAYHIYIVYVQNDAAAPYMVTSPAKGPAYTHTHTHTHTYIYNIVYVQNDAAAPCMVTSPAKGPILPLGTNQVTVHAIVDHEIVETIVNNRTAMVTYDPETFVYYLITNLITSMQAHSHVCMHSMKRRRLCDCRP